MKALVVSPQPFFSPRGTPFSVYYRTAFLADAGVEVDLLTYGQGQDVDLPGVRIIRIPAFRWLGKVKPGPSLLKLFFDVFLFWRTVALLVRHRYDFVHAHEEAVFYCRFLKPLFRFKLVYDMHSSLPQQLDNFEFTRSRLIKGVFQGLEASSIKAADAVITICPTLSDYVDDLIGDDPKHFMIENSVFDPVRLVGQRKDEGPAAQTPAPPPDKRIVLYAGTFEKYQGLELLIPAFALVRKQLPDAFLLMVGGDSAQVAALQTLAEQSGLADAVLFTGRVPQHAAKDYTDLASVLTSPRTAGTNTPLKVYEQLSTGKPVVATRIVAHTQVLTDEVAFLVEPNVEAIARGIIAALSDREVVESKLRCAEELYRSRYSKSVYEDKMRRLLEFLS
jgi:glycosyltransferase involved in cell wall biosynthesis